MLAGLAVRANAGSIGGSSAPISGSSPGHCHSPRVCRGRIVFLALALLLGPRARLAWRFSRRRCARRGVLLQRERPGERVVHLCALPPAPPRLLSIGELVLGSPCSSHDLASRRARWGPTLAMAFFAILRNQVHAVRALMLDKRRCVREHLAAVPAAHASASMRKESCDAHFRAVGPTCSVLQARGDDYRSCANLQVMAEALDVAGDGRGEDFCPLGAACNMDPSHGQVSPGPKKRDTRPK